MNIAEITLAGGPRDRGRTHGESLREPIADALDAWFQSLADRTDPRDLVVEVTQRSGLKEAAERYTPDLVEEVQGLAEGAAQSFETMFAWQLIDEVWWYLDDLQGRAAPVERCSAFAVNREQHGFVGQTQDLPRYFDGHQVMLRYLEPDGSEILAPSIAGLLALNGVNSHGLAVGITTLSQLAHSATGVASEFLVAAMLRCEDVDQALNLLATTPIASGNSFLLGSRDRSVVVETAADQMHVLDHDRVFHTNHVLELDPATDFVRFDSSLERLEQMQASIAPGVTLAELEEIYSTGAVCQSRSRDAAVLSVATMFFELGDTQVCHFAPGPLDTDALVPYRMTGC